jgi:hypothetical protein
MDFGFCGCKGVFGFLGQVEHLFKTAHQAGFWIETRFQAHILLQDKPLTINL